MKKRFMNKKLNEFVNKLVVSRFSLNKDAIEDEV